jgi:hypothetical protein
VRPHARPSYHDRCGPPSTYAVRRQ